MRPLRDRYAQDLLESKLDRLRKNLLGAATGRQASHAVVVVVVTPSTWRQAIVCS